VDELKAGIWDEVVDAVTARHPSVTLGKVFGMPCLKRANGKVVAALWKGGGITVELVDEKARAESLALPGAEFGTHAFDRRRKMREWVHVPATQSSEWERLVELALGSSRRDRGRSRD
jgi:hypothetical protein